MLEKPLCGLVEITASVKYTVMFHECLHSWEVQYVVQASTFTGWPKKLHISICLMLN